MLFRILKMIATSGFLTALECTKFVFVWSSAPDPAGVAYSSPPDPPSWFNTNLLLRGGKRGEGGEGEGRGGVYSPLSQIPGSALALLPLLSLFPSPHFPSLPSS